MTLRSRLLPCTLTLTLTLALALLAGCTLSGDEDGIRRADIVFEDGVAGSDDTVGGSDTTSLEDALAPPDAAPDAVADATAGDASDILADASDGAAPDALADVADVLADAPDAGPTCCPIADEPSCDCVPIGGSPDPRSGCGTICDAAPVDWELVSDENGCPLWIPGNESCHVPPDAG